MTNVFVHFKNTFLISLKTCYSAPFLKVRPALETKEQCRELDRKSQRQILKIQHNKETGYRDEHMKSLPYNDPKSAYVTNTDTEVFSGSENNPRVL